MDRTINTETMTVSQALEHVFSFHNGEIARRAGVEYSAAASWRKRYKAGGLSTDKAEAIILAFGFEKTEEHRYKLKEI